MPMDSLAPLCAGRLVAGLRFLDGHYSLYVNLARQPRKLLLNSSCRSGEFGRHSYSGFEQIGDFPQLIVYGGYLPIQRLQFIVAE